eukprot:CAMPEP_0116907808 /NCGR_PEP_ID=MMETSP0467-20121206/13321_1 /TAXON_ID=283647 /ORGANISM="Mesodinium pulex, Strain SPMC105" /LENGTH=113 /DNA_ID=CAMNT_0004582887 /DNA_START=1293 /DNA_END=1634 /DNA_ORIENTATION=+
MTELNLHWIKTLDIISCLMVSYNCAYLIEYLQTEKWLDGAFSKLWVREFLWHAVKNSFPKVDWYVELNELRSILNAYMETEDQFSADWQNFCGAIQNLFNLGQESEIIELEPE